MEQRTDTSSPTVTWEDFIIFPRSAKVGAGTVHRPFMFLAGDEVPAPALAAALTSPPTPREIATHIRRGRAVDLAWVPYRRQDPWTGSWYDGEKSAETWESLPQQDEPRHGICLLPPPKEVGWEIVQENWWMVAGCIYGEKIDGRYQEILEVHGDEVGRWITLRSGIKRAVGVNGLVPVRRQVNT